MAIDAILKEVAYLHDVGKRLEGFAEEHPVLSKGLLGISVSVRNAATVLSVLLATKEDGRSKKTIP